MKIDRTEKRFRIREVRSQIICIADSPETTAAATPATMAPSVRQMFELDSDPQENLCAVYLDSRMRIISTERVYRGTVNRASVDTRDIARSALLLNAVYVVIVHNHPSGDPSPSAEDLTYARRLQSALEILGVILQDSIVVAGGGRHSSLRERGLL